MSSGKGSSDKVSDVMLIDGKYYDTKKLAKVHPGGELMVLLCNGQDGTTIFNSYHRRAFPHAKYTDYVVPVDRVDPSVVTSIPPNQQDWSLYWEICNKIKGTLAPTNGFAPVSYYAKVAFILSVAVYLDLVFPLFQARTIWTSVVLGWFLGLIGLNIQHDANHGSVSRNPVINRILGLSQDYLGGGSIAWMVNHNTIHHVHCNDIALDHDMDIPFMRLHSKAPWYLPHLAQHLYFLVLAAFFGPTHIIASVAFMWQEPSKRERVFDSYRWTSRFITLLLPLRFLVLMVHGGGVLDAMMHVAIANMCGGLYLAFFFVISHNFVGVRKDDIHSHSDCFVKNQTETSCNVGYDVLCQFNGGLNYQIEHHLFPRVHHSYYPVIAPVVRAAIEQRGYKYVHFPTVLENGMSMLKHLAELGRKPSAAATGKKSKSD